MARVLFLDPYHGPSHRALSVALREHSRHDVTLLALPPRKWKWRMRGAALAFEPMVRELPPPEIVVGTDMLNLPEFLALLRDHLRPRTALISYFHENQMTYPVASGDERDFHFGLSNIHTALASDLVVFNSVFHRDQFLEAVPALVRSMPDQRPEGLAPRIRAHSEVLGPPLDLADAPAGTGARDNLILWNHRWEEDKDPEAFFRVMRRLDATGADFKLVVLGESFRDHPACFDSARRDLGHRIEHWGYLASRSDYLTQVARCRVVVSTARHEFFGLAVREAIAMGCLPLLPRRVVYPEMVGPHDGCLYDSEDDLLDLLTRVLADADARCPVALRETIASHSIAHVIARWDAWFDRMSLR